MNLLKKLTVKKHPLEINHKIWLTIIEQQETHQKPARNPTQWVSYILSKFVVYPALHAIWSYNEPRLHCPPWCHRSLQDHIEQRHHTPDAALRYRTILSVNEVSFEFRAGNITDLVFFLANPPRNVSVRFLVDLCLFHHWQTTRYVKSGILMFEIL